MIPMISSDEFIRRCKLEVAKDYFNSHDVAVSEDDIYVVWYCKTLQNHKALLSTNICDGMYYEMTYDGDRMQLYMDVYKKWDNRPIEW